MSKVTYVSYENLKTIWEKIDEYFVRKKWLEEQDYNHISVGSGDPDDSTPVGVYIDADTGNLWQWSE